MDFSKKQLIIFDIDGTLVDLKSIHIKAYEKAFLAGAGLKIRNSVRIVRHFGKPEAVLIKSILEENGVKSFTEEQVGNIIKAYEKAFAELAPQVSQRNVLVGVNELLAELSRGKKFLAVYSGNPRSIGVAILKRTGLDKYFPVQVYYDDIKRAESNSRANLLKEVIRRAKKLRKGITVKSIVTIGDSLSDVNASKLLGIDCIAVASGYTKRAALKKAGPAILLNSLEEIFNKGLLV